MNDIDDDTVKGVVGEEILDQMKAIHEYVKDIPAIKSDMHKVKATVEDISDRLKVVEAVVRDHEVDIQGLKRSVA